MSLLFFSLSILSPNFKPKPDILQKRAFFLSLEIKDPSAAKSIFRSFRFSLSDMKVLLSTILSIIAIVK
nr:hypothetical protein CFP56_15374 [Quercus suber]